MSDWVKFYDFKHSVIYVNARHRDVHYRRIAEDIRAYVPSPSAHVLDYGCGEATSADLVADACAQLVLVEAAPNGANPESRCRHRVGSGFRVRRFAAPRNDEHGGEPIPATASAADRSCREPDRWQALARSESS